MSSLIELQRFKIRSAVYGIIACLIAIIALIINVFINPITFKSSFTAIMFFLFIVAYFLNNISVSNKEIKQIQSIHNNHGQRTNKSIPNNR